MRKTVGGALFKNGKLLVVKRTNDRPIWPDKWEIPGGGLEHGEDDAAAIVREFFEETKIKIKPVRKYWSFREGQRMEENDYIVHAHSFNIVLDPGEHTEFKWIDRNEIDKLDANGLMKESMKMAFVSVGT